jgi:hypothetical protein
VAFSGATKKPFAHPQLDVAANSRHPANDGMKNKRGACRASFLAERLAFFVVEVALFDAVAKTLERSRLIRVRAVDKNSRRLAFQAESKIYIATKSIGDMLDAIFIKLIVDFRITVLEHMLLALEDTQH